MGDGEHTGNGKSTTFNHASGGAGTGAASAVDLESLSHAFHHAAESAEALVGYPHLFEQSEERTSGYRVITFD